jgi:hypothetical protein
VPAEQYTPLGGRAPALTSGLSSQSYESDDVRCCFVAASPELPALLRPPACCCLRPPTRRKDSREDWGWLSAALYSVPYVIGVHASCGQNGAWMTASADMGRSQEVAKTM